MHVAGRPDKEIVDRGGSAHRRPIAHFDRGVDNPNGLWNEVKWIPRVDAGTTFDPAGDHARSRMRLNEDVGRRDGCRVGDDDVERVGQTFERHGDDGSVGAAGLTDDDEQAPSVSAEKSARVMYFMRRQTAAAHATVTLRAERRRESPPFPRRLVGGDRHRLGQCERCFHVLMTRDDAIDHSEPLGFR